MSNANDFLDWKRHPITQTVMAEIQGRYEQLKEMLVDQAGETTHEALAMIAGGAKAYRDVLDIRFSDVQEETHGS